MVSQSRILRSGFADFLAMANPGNEGIHNELSKLWGVPLSKLSVPALAEIVGTTAVVAPVAPKLSSELLPAGDNLSGLLD